MIVELTGVVKVGGQWRNAGETIDLPNDEAKRLISIKAAITADGAAGVSAQDDIEGLRAELTRLQEFERQQLATAEAKEQADREAAERKAAEEAAAKGKAGAKGDADGQAAGK